MNYFILILQVVLVALILYLYGYAKKKGQNLALREDLDRITKIVEKIRLEHKKSLSEFDVKLESFRKVIEIRIDAAEQLAEIRKGIWGLGTFNKGSWEDVVNQIQSFTVYMNAYLPFFQDCREELEQYSKEMKKLEYKTSLSAEEMNPSFKAMEILLAKILEYK